MKRILILAAALALAMTMVIPASSLAVFEMYVYTRNGRTLNVRSAPEKGDNIIGRYEFGEVVPVDHHLGNGWSEVVFGSVPGYVMTSYLVSSPKEKPKDTGKDATASEDDALAAMNAEFRAANFVSPYSVVTRGKRSSALINLRWAPHKNAQLIHSYQSGTLLTVTAELREWYQVEDPGTGRTGYIRKDFLERAQ